MMDIVITPTNGKKLIEFGNQENFMHLAFGTIDCQGYILLLALVAHKQQHA